jgi:hypothetical protein
MQGLFRRLIGGAHPAASFGTEEHCSSGNTGVKI